jgi:hypothetical protein
MKNWLIIVIFLMGLAITIIGALFKIMHWPGASIMLIGGMGMKAVAVLMLIIKLLSGRKSNEWLSK